MESSRSLQTIALEATVGILANLARTALPASNTMRSRAIGLIRRMANGLHKVRVG
jgi:hypothetical protein